MAYHMSPRRRPQAASALACVAPLPKSSTFHTRVQHDHDAPIEQGRFMPRRAPTSSRTLEDMVFESNLIAQKKDAVSKLLQEFDDKINGRKPLEGLGRVADEANVHALPSFIVGHALVPDMMDIDKKPIVHEHHHDSDSGLGSSAATSIDQDHDHKSNRSVHSSNSISTTNSAVTRAASIIGAQTTIEDCLSKDAVRHIKKHIIQPILKKETLKDFHPLIEDIPRRISAKYISNLRDLEKTLFFLAPDFAPSPRAFLKFCETSIECLHTTVDYLSERDQRLPSDRPYTNNYFLDLVGQIRRYAEIMARTREKTEAGEPLNDQDYSPKEEIAIAGGLSYNGKPAELVRKKDGKVIPLSEHSALDESMPQMAKRQLSPDSETETADVYRSMARRRKSERPGDVMHQCRACDKEFKRPCDLTKHEKTHSRPWKCNVAGCRYVEQGWPTEKERDRHMNDKHNSAPVFFKCKFPPCSYSSKRESNCKQHMEKAHGWTYVRSKSNGRVKKADTEASSSNASSPQPLPSVHTPASSIAQMASPADSGFMATPPMYPRDATTGFRSFSFGVPAAQSTEDLFDFNTDRRFSAATSSSGFSMSTGSNFSPMQQNMPMLSAFEQALVHEDMTFDNSMFTEMMNTSLAPVQQPTPAMSHSSCDGLNDHVSPTGRVNMTLFTPHMPNTHFDEALGNDMQFGHDFTLFESPVLPSVNPARQTDMAAAWFPPDMGTIGGQFENMAYAANGFDDVFGQGQG